MTSFLRVCRLPYPNASPFPRNEPVFNSAHFYESMPNVLSVEYLFLPLKKIPRNTPMIRNQNWNSSALDNQIKNKLRTSAIIYWRHSKYFWKIKLFSSFQNHWFLPFNLLIDYIFFKLLSLSQVKSVITMKFFNFENIKNQNKMRGNLEIYFLQT
jgi:hypothetical protein